MAKRDYYDVLGLTKSASKDEIKKAYRKLALKFHPDKTKGDKSSEEKFKEASEAYHILSDEKRKANYDQFGHAVAMSGDVVVRVKTNRRPSPPLSRCRECWASDHSKEC